MQNCEFHLSDRGVGTLTIANRTALNLLDSATIQELSATLRDLATRPDLRALVLRGEGDRSFVGGVNLRELPAYGAREAVAFISRLSELCESVRDFPLPTIARIPGWCLGGGLELAAACDLRIGATAARFGMPEVRMGLPSVIHANLLPRLIGEGRTRWLLLTGALIDADKALAWGFLNEAVDLKALDAAVDQTLDELLAGAPHAVRAQKALLQAWEDAALERGLKESIAAFGRSFETGEPAECIARFFANKAR
jgi:enoyl-CoA hydratase/carnithine racemase